jgi:pimeloyl-ACP methyl ester carboxylesterase
VLLVHGFPDSHGSGGTRFLHLVAAATGSSHLTFAVLARVMFSPARQLPGGEFCQRPGGLTRCTAYRQGATGRPRLGAAIGWAFAIAHPQRVDRLVAMSVGHPAAYPRGGLAQNSRAIMF